MCRKQTSRQQSAHHGVRRGSAPLRGSAPRNTTMKPTPDWAAAWDAYWLAPSSAWESYWRGTGLSCGATGLCSMLGQPIDADDLVLLTSVSALAALTFAMRTRRVCTAILLFPSLSVLLLKLQPKIEALLEKPPPPLLDVLPEVPLGLISCKASSGTAPTTYLPGAIEQHWIRPDWRAAGHICDVANGDEQVAAAKEWLDYAKAASSRRADGMPARKSIAGRTHEREPPMYTPLQPAPVSAEQLRQLSFFREADGAMHPIEPLTGMGRHPLATSLCGYHGEHAASSIYNLSYLILANRCDPEGRQKPPPTSPHACTTEEAAALIDAPRAASSAKGSSTASTRPRNLYYDLGCTVYDDGTTVATSSGSGRGPSIPLFTRMYEERCVVFDQIFGWEMQPHPRSRWFSKVPARMMKRLHFHNVGVREGSMSEVLINRTWAKMPVPASKPSSSSSRRRSRSQKATRASPASPTSFLRHLRETATERDFVVVKLDVDGGPEQQILQALATFPELRTLVDEFFFEWHYRFDYGRDFGWGRPKPAANTVDHALRMMQKLRHHGVRAHFWI